MPLPVTVALIVLVVVVVVGTVGYLIDEAEEPLERGEYSPGERHHRV